MQGRPLPAISGPKPTLRLHESNDGLHGCKGRGPCTRRQRQAQRSAHSKRRLAPFSDVARMLQMSARCHCNAPYYINAAMSECPASCWAVEDRRALRIDQLVEWCDACFAASGTGTSAAIRAVYHIRRATSVWDGIICPPHSINRDALQQEANRQRASVRARRGSGGGARPRGRHPMPLPSQHYSRPSFAAGCNSPHNESAGPGQGPRASRRCRRNALRPAGAPGRAPWAAQ